MPLNVLIADDDICIRDVLTEICKMRGVVSVAVASAEEAIETLRSSPGFGLAILDNNYGRARLKGIEAVPQIRQFRPELPIYLFTSDQFTDEQIREAGLTGHIHSRKPGFGGIRALLDQYES